MKISSSSLRLQLPPIQIVERENQVKRLDASTYRVKSQNGNGSYLVVIQGSEYRCECPDWKFRGELLLDKACKHIVAVRASLALRQSVSKTSVDLAPQPEECKVCKSSRIVKQGLRHTKNGDVQRYLCKDCGYRFVLSLDGFSKMKAEPKIVVSALDLFFKGLSLRKIADHIKQNYGREFHNTAILKWIRKYTDLIKGYVETLNPKLSAVWHVDEMKQSMGETKKLEWVWNVLDEDTRFWLASQISHTREVGDARRVLYEAKKIAKTDIGKNVNKPLKIVSDGLQSYPEAIRKEFYTMKGPRTEHVRAPGITGRPHNNIIERLNGTKRERMKVMRGYDGMETGQKTTDGERIYYNYIREHSAIGMTPAQKAGISLGLGQNKWMDLIKQSATPSPKTALGDRVNLVEISETKDSETAKPKRWLDREMWKEINSILRTFGFAWISNGKDSLWLKPLSMSRQSAPASQQTENP